MKNITVDMYLFTYFGTSFFFENRIPTNMAKNTREINRYGWFVKLVKSTNRGD